ncbi:MAG: hypothetical protein N2746_11900 [Deltaproteobacteria bacterium]|nr:hypothetical protein [Deltaproteobacteria bacterium]
MRIINVFFVCTSIIILQSQLLYSLENTTNSKNELSLSTGLALSIIPGFGAGNYYAKNFSKGLTFTLIDASLTGITIWAYTETKITDYSIISLGVIPTILILFKAIQFKTVYDDIEAYNNRYTFKKP